MNSNWFRHDNDAHSDERCSALIARTGYEGYGMLWHLLERMHRSTDGRISLGLLDGIAWDMKVEVAKLKQVLDTCLLGSARRMLTNTGRVGRHHLPLVRITNSVAGG